MEARPRTVKNYVDANKRCPFDEWLGGLTDLKGRAQIDARIARLRLGGLGEWDDVGEGVIELIFKNTGPGYRVYIGQAGNDLVILLGGGIKRTQASDIERAKACWQSWKDCNK